jgi:hypothetical protein
MYGLGVGESLFAYEEGGVEMDTIRRAMDTFANDSSGNKVRLKSIVSHGDPADNLRELNYRLNSADITVIEKSDHLRVDIERTIERSDIDGGERTVAGSFALFQNLEGEGQIWTAVTGNGPDFFKRALLWVFKRGEPEFTSFYVTANDLKSVLDQLSHFLSTNAKIRATKVVAYSRQEEGNVSFETRPYEAVFRASDEENRYVDKIRFTVLRNDTLLFSGFMARDGQLKFIDGNVDVFFNNLVSVYAELGQEKVEVFSDKERSRDTGDINQIELEFEEQVFQRVEDNVHLIDALENLKNSSITVYHNNPYAHVSVFDFIDGSSCDVFITEPDSVSIVPSYRGSLNSLMRISEQISREVDEALAHDAQQTEYEFSDFFSS